MTVEYGEVLTETSSIDMGEVYSEFPEVQRIFGEASMRQILTSDKAPDELKMKALVSLAENTRKNEIALIRQTLSDRNDEIRLYSFAVIDKLERNINNTIHTKLDNYHQAMNNKERAKLAGEIAKLYWEMLYFELADEDLKHFIALEVDHYATEALEEYPENTALNALLGRCCLIIREYECARKYFEKLINKHRMRENSITPYLAELYYIKHDYQHVKQLMHDASSLRSNQLLNPVIEIWNEKESA
jgi:tetratricopeptide (TPR) repeat protein